MESIKRKRIRWWQTKTLPISFLTVLIILLLGCQQAVEIPPPASDTPEIDAFSGLYPSFDAKPLGSLNSEVEVVGTEAKSEESLISEATLSETEELANEASSQNQQEVATTTDERTEETRKPSESLQPLLKTQWVKTHSDCEGQALVIRNGLDADLDEELNEAEVHETSVRCLEDEQPGHNALVRTQRLEKGPDCPSGGVIFQSGQDRDRNGVLTAEEVQSYEEVCVPSTPSLKPTDPAVSLPAVRLAGRDLPPSEAEKNYVIKNASMQSAQEIKGVLIPIAEELGINLIIDSDFSAPLKTNVEARFKNIPLDDFLHSILQPLGAAFTRRGNLLRIHARKQQTRIYRLDQLQLTQTASTSISTNSASESGGSEVSSEIVTDFFAHMEKGLEAILGEEAGPQKNSFLVNRPSGLVLIKAYPEGLEEVDAFLQNLIASSQRQVRIRTQVAEITLGEGQRFGVNWQNIGNEVAGGKLTFNQSAFSPDDAGFFSVQVDGSKTSALLQAMQDSENIKMLSAPDILVTNGEPANIKVATEEVFFEENRTTNAETNQDSFDVETKAITVGVSIMVTPQIAEDSVMLQFRASITDLLRKEVLERNGNVVAQAPVTNERQLSTVVRLRDRQTAILAGMIREQAVEKESKVPLLSSIPWLGRLFRSKESTLQNTELAILLTPEIHVPRIEQVSLNQRSFLKEKFPEHFND